MFVRVMPHTSGHMSREVKWIIHYAG